MDVHVELQVNFVDEVEVDLIMELNQFRKNKPNTSPNWLSNIDSDWLPNSRPTKKTPPTYRVQFSHILKGP